MLGHVKDGGGIKMVKNKNNEHSDKKLLKDIRALLVVVASKLGAKSDEIGKALGVKGSQVRKIRTGNA